MTTHAARPGEDHIPACGQADPWDDTLSHEQAHDPDHEPFDCGRCWSVLAGGAEPMGGTRP